jgi:hypothetical protein
MADTQGKNARDTIKILETMTPFQTEPPFPTEEYDLLWTSRILGSLSAMSPQRANVAVTKLQLCGYLARREGTYTVTDDGMAYYTSRK